MKIEKSTVTKLRITDIKSLDPITCYVEDYGVGKGKITIEIFGKSWTAAWMGMGDMRILEFITTCNYQYLIGKLAPMMDSTVPSDDPEMLTKHLREKIVEQRWHDDLSKKEARELYDRCAHAYYEDHDLLYRVIGDEYWYDMPKEENHEYFYLKRVVEAVKEAIVQHLEEEQVVA